MTSHLVVVDHSRRELINVHLASTGKAQYVMMMLDQSLLVLIPHEPLMQKNILITMIAYYN